MSDESRLGEIGEHRFLERFCARLAREPAGVAGPAVLVGPGDDCAVVEPGDRPLALTTDALVEGVHFRRDWLSASELGARAVQVSLSDLAAMGAAPRFVLVAVVAPVDARAGDLDALLDGCAAASSASGARMVGGNLARGDRLSITVTAIGSIEGRWLSRSGARPGDRLIVTGTLGDAAAAVAAWLAGGAPAPELRDRFARPEARIAAGHALSAAGAHAAIDVSDGLLADLGHLCTASGVGARIDRERLPRSAEVARLDAAGADFAASGGDDYELLVALPENLAARLDSLVSSCGVALTEVGRCTAASTGIQFVDARGHEIPVRARGFDHFAKGATGAPVR